MTTTTGSRTALEELAGFVVRASWDDMSDEAREALKIRVLDAIACALGALHAETPQAIRAYVDDVGGRDASALIGGGRTAPDRAALYNATLVRYSTSTTPTSRPARRVTRATRWAACSPRPTRRRARPRSARGAGDVLPGAVPAERRGSRPGAGFDHTIQLAYGAAAGVARVLGLDETRTANAIAIAGTR